MGYVDGVEKHQDYRRSPLYSDMRQEANWVLRTRPDLPLAACRGEDVNIFHREPRHSGPGKFAYEIQRNQDALQVCYGCPERLACLTAAMEGGERKGIYGGIIEHVRSAAITAKIAPEQVIEDDRVARLGIEY